MKDAGIRVSLFVDPEETQIKASQALGADEIELHTGCYANTNKVVDQDKEYNRLYIAADLANNQTLKVNAGHGLNYLNTHRICSLPNLQELNIGHSIVSRSIFVGIVQAVKEMREIINFNS